jgi:hypothetical protein
MSGPEKQFIHTESSKKLAESGIERTGFNWMTAFIDMPDNFEDQIIINKKHLDNVATSSKKFTSYTTPTVSVGDNVSVGDSLSDDVIMDVHCDNAVITNIEIVKSIIDNKEFDIFIITLEIRRVYKDGFKFTNMHGNKGIAVFGETGTVYNPITGKDEDIDIIVGAKTVDSRKNYGQILEALMNLLNNKKQITLKDNYLINVDKMLQVLDSKGLKDGTCKVKTELGELDAICGYVFWGLVKEPESSIWTKQDVA